MIWRLQMGLTSLIIMNYYFLSNINKRYHKCVGTKYPYHFSGWELIYPGSGSPEHTLCLSRLRELLCLGGLAPHILATFTFEVVLSRLFSAGRSSCLNSIWNLKPTCFGQRSFPRFKQASFVLPRLPKLRQ